MGDEFDDMVGEGVRRPGGGGGPPLSSRKRRQ